MLVTQKKMEQMKAQSEAARKAVFGAASGSVATPKIADAITEYKATRGTAAVKLLHRVLGKLVGLKCNHCGKEVSITTESH